jgi:hypothetical protein
LPPTYTQKQDEEIELMQTYPSLLTVTTTKDKDKRQKKDTQYTNMEGGQGMTEGLLAEDQPGAGNDDFFTDRGRLGE